MIRNSYDMPVEAPPDSGDFLVVAIIIGFYIWAFVKIG